MGVYQDKHQIVSKGFPLEVGEGDGQEGTLFTLNTSVQILYFQRVNTMFTSFFFFNLGQDLDPFVVS